MLRVSKGLHEGPPQVRQCDGRNQRRRQDDAGSDAYFRVHRSRCAASSFPSQLSVVPNSTPSGITLVDVTSAFGGGGGGGSSAELYYRRLGDTDGKPLYTFDQDGKGGKSTCVAACAKEFPPYLVAKDAVAFGP